MDGFIFKGVIEGFYGVCWTHEQRLDMLEFMGKKGLNLYIFAPKDDPKHLKEWREPYTAEELTRFYELCETGRKNGVEVCYAISPGQSIDFRSRYEQDVEMLMDKLDTLYAQGIRRFALLLDDLPQHTAEAAENHARLVNDFRKRYFLRHNDLPEMITIFVEYFNDFISDEYTGTLIPLLNKDVIVMWTGDNTWDLNIYADRDFGVIDKLIGRKVLFWYNFPCNDYIPALLNIDGVKWLDPKLPEAILGIVSNGMTQPEAEKLPLSTIADYLNDPEHYDRDKSYDKALRELFPDFHEALGFVLSTLYSGIINKHEDSVPFARALAKKDFKGLYNLFVRLRDDAEKILNEEPNRAFVEQIHPWLEKARLYGKAGARLMESLDAATLGEFWDDYRDFMSLSEKAMRIPKFVSKNTLTPFFTYTAPLLAKEKIEIITGKEIYDVSSSTVSVCEKAEVSSSAGSYKGEYPVSAMTDGCSDTFYWSDCAADEGFYVQLDLGSITEIHNIVLFSGVGKASEDYIREGQILLSDDGIKWNKIGTAQHTGRVILDGLNEKARYLRYMSVSSQGFWFSCEKFAVNETLVNPHISCTAITEYSHSAPNLADGCLNTFFRVKNAPIGSKIIIDVPDFAENMAILGENCAIKNVAGMNQYEITFSGNIAVNEFLLW